MEDRLMAIRGHPNYYISDQGEVYNSKGQKLRHKLDKDGYHHVILYKDGRQIQLRIARLVAEYFIPNPYNKPQVNHKDGKDKNDYMSIEWSTPSENTKHSFDNGLHKVDTVIQLLDGKEIARYESAVVAEQRTGISRGNINSTISRNATSGGYHWKRTKEVQ